MQVARQCDPAKARSNSVTIHVAQVHSHGINSQSLSKLQYLPHLKSNLPFQTNAKAQEIKER